MNGKGKFKFSMIPRESLERLNYIETLEQAKALVAEDGVTSATGKMIITMNINKALDELTKYAEKIAEQGAVEPTDAELTRWMTKTKEGQFVTKKYEQCAMMLYSHGRI